MKKIEFTPTRRNLLKAGLTTAVPAPILASCDKAFPSKKDQGASDKYESDVKSSARLARAKLK
jgi:hypothetical protein